MLFFLTPLLRNCRFFGVSPIVLLCGTGEKEKYPQSKEKLKQQQSDVVERFPPSSLLCLVMLRSTARGKYTTLFLLLKALILLPCVLRRKI